MAARGVTDHRIEYLPLDEIRPDPRNPKKHAVELMRESTTRFGFVEPMVLDERTGRLIAGHGRRELLLDDRATGRPAPEGVVVDGAGGWLVPVVRGWASTDDDEAFGYLVAANRIGEQGGWLTERLLAGLEPLAAKGPDMLVGVGYTPDDLSGLLALLQSEAPPVVGATDPDEVPEPPPEPVSRRGDLWLCGPHRVLCGDSTVLASFDRVLGGEHLAGAVIADPPYGVAIGAKNRALDAIDRAGRVLTDLDGDQGIEEVETLWRAAFGTLAEAMPPGCPYYVFGPQGGDLGLLLLLLLRDSGLSPRHILIWVKNRASFSIGRLDYDYQHEPIVYGWKPGGPHPWHADGSRTSVIEFDRPQASRLHPTMKPVGLLVGLIENSTTRGQLVLDPFAGSGSTLIACHSTGRKARLIEKDEHYADVICRRYQEFTGDVPVLESTGEPHDFCAEPSVVEPGWLS